jgi:hypothetical protein
MQIIWGIFPQKTRKKRKKNRIFLRAQTTAKTRKRQERVFRSKYSMYFASGGTKKQVTIAQRQAISITTFFLEKVTTAFFI